MTDYKACNLLSPAQCHGLLVPKKTNMLPSHRSLLPHPHRGLCHSLSIPLISCYILPPPVHQTRCPLFLVYLYPTLHPILFLRLSIPPITFTPSVLCLTISRPCALPFTLSLPGWRADFSEVMLSVPLLPKAKGLLSPAPRFTEC